MVGETIALFGGATLGLMGVLALTWWLDRLLYRWLNR